MLKRTPCKPNMILRCYLTFAAQHFIPRMPADVQLTPVDRTIGKDTLVDEFIFEFTHTVVILLPEGRLPSCRRRLHLHM